MTTSLKNEANIPLTPIFQARRHLAPGLGQVVSPHQDWTDMKHFAHQAIDGSWHCVYRTPGCQSLTSVGAGTTEEQAKQEARTRNEEAARQQAASEANAKLLQTPGPYRSIPSGFYTNADAS